jgi:hypothetical protein
LLCTTVALLAALGAPAAGAGSAPSVASLKAARTVNFFYFGSSANPLLNRTCGKVIGGSYILPAPSGQGLEKSCTVPRDTPLLAAPGGAIAWAPTDGETSAELIASRDRFLAGLSDPVATVDGHAVPVETVKSYVHPLKLQPGNLVQTIDHLVEGTSTQVATGTFLASIAPLALGRHEVVLSSLDNGQPFDITFHLTVR